MFDGETLIRTYPLLQMFCKIILHFKVVVTGFKTVSGTTIAARSSVVRAAV